MKKQREEWKQVDGRPYEVSNLGRVRRSPGAKIGPGRIVPPIKEHVRVSLQVSGKTQRCLVHLLVAEAFVGPRPKGHTANHKDGDKGNNRADNLEWLTRNANQRHAYDLGLAGRGEKSGRAVLNNEQVREIRRRYRGKWGEQTALAKEYGVSQSLIAKIVRGEVWIHLDPKYRPKACREARGGEAHGAAKLTSKKVRTARRAYVRGVSIATLAKRYGVRDAIMRDVLYGKTWKHVT